MRRAVIDPNVLISALITPKGAAAELLMQLRDGELEAIVSPLLLKELEGVLRRKKFRHYADLEAVDAFLERLRVEAILVPDPEGQAPIRSADPKDDYLLDLAFHQKAMLISGDSHLVEIAGGAPICMPADLLAEPA